MKKALATNVPVIGIPSVQRAVVNVEEEDEWRKRTNSPASAGRSRATSPALGGETTKKKRYHLLVEGLGLRAVMGVPGVNGRKTRTNHIMEMEKVLGIEAARTQALPIPNT